MTQFDDIVRERRTLKLLGNPGNPAPTGGLSRQAVEDIVATAGWAPFHRASHRAREGETPVCEPWRVAMLDAEACRALLPRLSDLPIPPKKIADMLAVADALVLVTWMPEPSSGGGWEATEFNMEHIAAASAVAHTVTLAATGRGIHNYWSSGGVLATPEAFDLLGIDRDEVLIGAIFLFPDPPEGSTPLTGKLREKRSARDAWSRWVTPD